MAKLAKPAAQLRFMLAAALGILPGSPEAAAIIICPVGDTWRAMSGRYDDDPAFRSKVIRLSIEMAEIYDLAT